jgi:hypothetical protein
MANADFADVNYMHMSASLLASQPLTPKDKQQQPLKYWDRLYTHLESRLSQLRNWRWSWWTYWSRLAELYNPRRYTWLVVANKMTRGGALNDNIIDSTGLLAVRTCAAGLWTGLTSPSRPWFKLGSALPWVQIDAQGKEWIEDTEERLYTLFAQSNFYTIMAQAFQDVVVFGTAPITIYEDMEDGIRCYLPAAGEYYLGVGARLAVDTNYTERTYTVLQIVEQFGLENCPESIQKQWEEGGGSVDLEYVVCQAIEPNFAISSQRRGGEEIKAVPGIFSYREVYWLKGNKGAKPLSIRGFHKKPFIAMRWSTVSNDAYGRSVCMDALGDSRQAQTETKRKAEYIEKGVRPPMGADPELKTEPASIHPGMITYTSTAGGKKGFWPLFDVNPAWLTGLTADIAQVNERIKDALFVNLFMAISQMEGVQPRNELELTKRDLERLQELGPFITQFENESATPAIDRVMEIMQRNKMLKPKPKSLQGVPLGVKFTSILRLAQQAAESVAMKDMFATAGELSSAAHAAGVPDPIRVINLDKAFRKYGDLNNFPVDCLFTEEEVAEHDQARKQAQQAAQQPGQAQAAVEAAKTLSETSIAPGSALSSMIGGGSGAPGQ